MRASLRRSRISLRSIRATAGANEPFTPFVRLISREGGASRPPRFCHAGPVCRARVGLTGRAPCSARFCSPQRLVSRPRPPSRSSAGAHANPSAAAQAGQARRRELLDLARADLRRRHLRPHQRRDALLFGAGSARRLAAGRQGQSQSRRVGAGCRQAARAPRRHRGPAGRGRRGRRLRHDADRSGEALPGAPRPARDRHGRPADHRGAERSGEDAHPPARGLARPAARARLHLRPALRGGEHSGRRRRGGGGRQGRRGATSRWSARSIARRRR